MSTGAARRRLGGALAAGAAAALVAGAAEAARAQASGGGRPPEHVRAVAHEVLSRREFHPDESTNYLEEALRWIGDHLVPDFVRHGFGTGPGFLGPLVYLAIIGGIAYAVWTLARSWTRLPKVSIPVAETVVEVEEARTAAEWGRMAAELERAGRLREALRARYGELVAELVDDGSLSSLPGRTSGELRAEIGRTRPAADEPFAAATAAFEDDWYGGAEPSAADLERFRALAATVVASPRVAEGATR